MPERAHYLMILGLWIVLQLLDGHNRRWFDEAFRGAYRSVLREERTAESAESGPHSGS